MGGGGGCFVSPELVVADIMFLPVSRVRSARSHHIDRQVQRNEAPSGTISSQKQLLTMEEKEKGLASCHLCQEAFGRALPMRSNYTSKNLERFLG